MMAPDTNVKLPDVRRQFKAAAATMVAAPLSAQAGILDSLQTPEASWGLLLAVPALAVMLYLLKNVPKKPAIRIVPHLRLLYNLVSQKLSPQRLQWWQALPIALATAATTFALTKPSWNPEAPLTGTGPVLLPIDNGWPSARDWKSRHEQLLHLIDRAGHAGRQVFIAPTAAQDGTPLAVLGPFNASEAREAAQKIAPQPWPSDRAAALKALSVPVLDGVRQSSVIWLSDGLTDPHTPDYMQKLQSFGSLTVIEDDKILSARIIDQPVADAADLTIPVRRANTAEAETISLQAVDEKGDPIEQAEAVFKPGDAKAEAVFKISPDRRNKVYSVTIHGDNTAGARLLIDESSRRRSVGVIDTGNSNSPQPLTDEAHYLRQALNPFVDLHRGSVDHLLEGKLSQLVMADSANVSAAQSKKIETWVNEGGTLVRFAGPRLEGQISKNNFDSLLPLPLGLARALDNNVTGSAAGKIKPFTATSPLADIKIPEEISIKRQILPKAGADNNTNTWARLQDDTAFITASKKGKGQIILIHTSVADAQYGMLGHSGLIVDILRASVKTSHAVASTYEGSDVALPAVRTLNAYGRTQNVTPTPKLTGEAIAKGHVTPLHPPGLYGNKNATYAHNLAVGVPELKSLGELPGDIGRKTYAVGKKDQDLTGYAWALAILALMSEMGIMFAQSRSKTPGKATERTAGQQKLTPDS